jgi:hypothetical protein
VDEVHGAAILWSRVRVIKHTPNVAESPDAL